MAEGVVVLLCVEALDGVLHEAVDSMQRRSNFMEMIMANCPVCECKFDVKSDILPGEILHCPKCDAELEVISVSPVQFALAPKVEEDWGE